MRWRITLSVRAVAIVIAGFIALQILIVLATSLPSRGTQGRPYGLPAPQEAATMVATIERSAPAERATLVGLFDRGLYTVDLSPAGVTPSRNATTEDLVLLGRYYAAALPGHAVAVDAQRPVLGALFGSRPRPARFFAPVTITISLADGSALTLGSRPSPTMQRFLRQRALVGALGGLILLGILALAMRHTMRPISRLARNVRDFGHRLEAPDLPVQGPREVQDLARAFNEMKGRIGTLMAERTRTLAAIAHDMRTYLTRLRLRADYIDDPDHRARAARDLDEMAALLDDTLLLARVDAVGTEAPHEAIDLQACVRSALDQREPGEALTVRLAGQPVMVRARPQAVRRILDNLLDNGLRYAEQVALTLETRGGQAVLTVSDNGPGIAPDMLRRLGEPFIRADPSRDRESGGAGLGLAIVRALATRDGAEVLFENKASGGLHVTLRYGVVGD